jgi:ABC-type lipoprotein export system ATPase subunit
MNPAPAELPGGPLVARALHYRRAGRTILDDVTVSAQPGRVLGVVGPSGSGKSTLLALLAGLDAPDAGIAELPANARVGLVLQSYGLVNLLTAAENVEIALQPGAGRAGSNRRVIRDRAAAALAAVGLTPVRDHLLEELSGGQQQRVAIARALVVSPNVLIADEFAAELDHEAKQQAIGLIAGVARLGGIVVAATHDPDVVAHCDDVVRLVDGRVAPA